MAQRKSQDRRMVRNRRVMIYTFLIILTLFYISAHRKLERERALDLAAAGAGNVAAADFAGAGGNPAADGKGTVVDDRGTGKGHGPEGSMEGERADGRLLLSGQANEEADYTGGMAGTEELFISQDDMWCLILTNAEYPVPEDYEVGLKAIPGTEQSVDERIYEPLMQMLEDMKAQGLSPVVCSGYRTLDKQEKLFNRKVQSYVRSGHTKEESYILARQTISIPGSGEHCLGLAIDFYTKKFHKLEKAFEDTPEGRWLMEHAQDYGFIMRYGENKTDITGIEYEPWHYRYVGVEAAKYIKEHNLTLEEFYIEQSLYG